LQGELDGKLFQLADIEADLAVLRAWFSNPSGTAQGDGSLNGRGLRGGR